MEYFFLTKFFVSLSIILSHLFFLVLIITFVNFNLDSPTYNMDYIGLTRLSKNFHFSLCSTLDCSNKMYLVVGGNIMILLILFFQELLFSNKDIRKIFTKRCTSDLIYFPKFLSRIVTSFSLIMSMMLFQPMRMNNYWKIDLSDNIRSFWFIIPFLIGLIQFIKSLYFHYIMNDELGGVLMTIFFKGTDVPRPADYLYGEGIFQKVRAPFRGGVLLMMFFINPRWDLGRIIYTGLFAFLMYAETVNEEKYFFVKFDSYKKYMQVVPYRFLNYSLIWNKKKINIKTEEKDEKKEEEKEKKSHKDSKKEK